MRILIVTVVFGLVAGSAFAQNPNGNGNYNPCPGDKEYQFNIIATSTKNPDMQNNDGHRIFVNLDGSTRIYMTGDTDTLVTGDNYGWTNGDLNCGTKFDVLDANGTGTNGKALLLVPCDPLTASNLNPDVCFNVYATPLGKAGSSGATIDVVCAFDGTCLGCNIDGGSCTTGTIDKTLATHSGRPVVENITSLFRASGCIDLDPLVFPGCTTGDIQFKNEWIFNIQQLLYYYWDYDANGNRLTQIRFCNAEGLSVADGGCGPNTLK